MNTKRRNELIEILNNFYWEGVAHVMYFTEQEAEILAEYLIKNGVIVVDELKENNHEIMD